VAQAQREERAIMKDQAILATQTRLAKQQSLEDEAERVARVRIAEQDSNGGAISNG